MIRRHFLALLGSLPFFGFRFPQFIGGPLDGRSARKPFIKEIRSNASRTNWQITFHLDENHGTHVIQTFADKKGTEWLVYNPGWGDYCDTLYFKRSNGDYREFKTVRGSEIVEKLNGVFGDPERYLQVIIRECQCVDYKTGLLIPAETNFI